MYNQINHSLNQKPDFVKFLKDPTAKAFVLFVII